MSHSAMKKCTIAAIALLMLSSAALFSGLTVLVQGDLANPTISGMVKGDVDGNGVVGNFEYLDGAKVTLVNVISGATQDATTENGGSFQFTPAAGYYMIRVSPQVVGTSVYLGYETSIMRLDYNEKVMKWITLPDAEKLDSRAYGKVVDSDGTAVSGAEVQLESAGFDYTFTTKTDAAGKFSVKVFQGTFEARVYKEGSFAPYIVGGYLVTNDNKYAQLAHKNVVNGTLVVTQDGALLAETADYTVDYAKGNITLLTPVADGTVIDANYTYLVKVTNEAVYTATGTEALALGYTVKPTLGALGTAFPSTVLYQDSIVTTGHVDKYDKTESIWYDTEVSDYKYTIETRVSGTLPTAHVAGIAFGANDTWKDNALTGIIEANDFIWTDADADLAFDAEAVYAGIAPAAQAAGVALANYYYNDTNGNGAFDAATEFAWLDTQNAGFYNDTVETAWNSAVAVAVNGTAGIAFPATARFVGSIATFDAAADSIFTDADADNLFDNEAVILGTPAVATVGVAMTGICFEDVDNSTSFDLGEFAWKDDVVADLEFTFEDVFTGSMPAKNAVGKVLPTTLKFEDADSDGLLGSSEIVWYDADNGGSFGETVVSLDHFPATDVVMYINGTMVAATEYTWNVATGKVTFDAPLKKLQVVKATYNYSLDVATETAKLYPSNYLTVTLGEMFMGGILCDEGILITESSYVTLYDRNTGYTLKRTMATGTYMVGAYAGDFILVVDPVGYTPYTELVTVTPADVAAGDLFLGWANLTASEPQKTVYTVDFSDWNNFDLVKEITIVPDSSIPGMDNADLGNARAQIDIALGNGDGVLSAAELALFQDWMEFRAVEFINTDSFVKVDGIYYNSSDVATDYTVAVVDNDAAAAVSIDSAETITVTITVPYTSSDDIEDDDAHTVAFTGVYDTTGRFAKDVQYVFDWPVDFEMDAHTTKANVAVDGHLVVTLDPNALGTGKSTSTMTVRTLEVPSMSLSVNTSPYWVYVERDDEGNITRYVAQRNKVVNFTGPTNAADLVGEIDTYTWNFGDATSAVTEKNWATHTYTTGGKKTVTLTCLDTGGETNTTSIELWIDTVVPTPVVRIAGQAVATYTVNQSTPLVFNGSLSSDLLQATPTSVAGRILTWKFDWGEKNETILNEGDDMDVAYEWVNAGTYSVKLTVYDMVDLNATVTVTVIVKDSTGPTTIFYPYAVESGKYKQVQSVKRYQTVWFDANATEDNTAAKTAIKFCWNFAFDEDDPWEGWENYTAAPGTGHYVDHVYDEISSDQTNGVYIVNLTTIDSLGNKAWHETPLRVSLEALPDLSVDLITIKGDFFEDKEITVRVNVTNYGLDKATNIKVTLYADGDKVSSQTLDTLAKPATNSVANKHTFTFKWTPEDKGNYTLKVKVESAGEDVSGQLKYAEHETTLIDNEKTKYVTIEKAEWKEWAVWIGIPAVVLIAVVVYYLVWGREGASKKD